MLKIPYLFQNLIVNPKEFSTITIVLMKVRGFPNEQISNFNLRKQFYLTKQIYTEE